MRYFFIFSFFFIFPLFISAQKNTPEIFKEINRLRSLSQDNTKALEERFSYVQEAIKLSKQTKKDSSILISNRALSNLYFLKQDLDSFFLINQQNLKLAQNLKDSLRSSSAYVNIAYYYKESSIVDSSYHYYFKARKIYKAINKPVNEASSLLNMANLQESERDFIGSEINAIEAIKILKNTPKTAKTNYLLWSLHNLIGVVSGQVERFDEAIEYHNKAIEYSKEIEDNYILQLYSKTNIAILNRRKGNYNEAARQFKNLLRDQSIKEKDPSTYASLLSALAYTKFLKNDSDDVEIESLFRESLHLAKKIDDEFEVMTASEYFAEYFLNRKNTDSAQFYANQTYEIAKEVSENKTFLNALLLKAKIAEGETAKNYFFRHIKLSDSLLLSERVIRNKFARIDYETDEIKKENEVISRQRLWLIIITYSLLLTFVSVYIIVIQRQRNKVLKFTQSQQEANEEIYNLMLTQKNEVEEVKASERKRISRDLHDGVLGRLFGARLSLDSINSDSSELAIKNRGNYIKELKDIEHDLRKVSHKLNEDFITNSTYFDIIKALVERQTNAYNLNYSFKLNSEVNWDLLDNKKKIHLYRILQETLHNVFKHAKATQIEISIEQNNFLLSLGIKDNGIGFDIKKSKKGIGFKSMKSRLKEINGKLIVESKINEGTLILFEIKN